MWEAKRKLQFATKHENAYKQLYSEPLNSERLFQAKLKQIVVFSMKNLHFDTTLLSHKMMYDG